MKAVYALIIASFLMIAFGFLLILQQEPEPTSQADKSQAPTPVLGLIPAPAPLETEPTQNEPNLDVMAQPGTEVWCEQMLHVADADWSREDSQTFADHCI